MARRDELVLSKLPGWAELNAALENLRFAFPDVQPVRADVTWLWLALIAKLATPATLADDSLSALWALAATDGIVPETLTSSSGPVPITEIFVTSSADFARRARTLERIVVTLDERTLSLWASRGAQDLSQLLEPKWRNTIGPVQPLSGAVPELIDVLRPEVRDAAACQLVSELQLKLGETLERVSCLM